MIAKPTTRDQALSNAINAAENADMAAEETRRGAGAHHAKAWSAASLAWSEIASLMPEVRVVDDLSGIQDQMIRGVVREIHNDKTLDKVRDALRGGIMGATEETVTGLITAMQNAGILFRERANDGALTPDEWETIQALREGTAVVTPVSRADMNATERGTPPAETVVEGETMTHRPSLADPVFWSVMHSLALRGQRGRGPLRVTDVEVADSGKYEISATRSTIGASWIVRVSPRS